MKIAWKSLVILGALLVIVAFSMDTSVGTFGGQRVVNLSLQGQQQMLLILGCVMFLAGIVLFAVLKVKQTPAQEAEEVRRRDELFKAKKEDLMRIAESSTDKVDGLLRKVEPAGDHTGRRLIVGVLVGAVWATLAGGLSRSEFIGIIFFIVPVVFALWRGPAAIIVQRLLKLNIVVVVVLSAILISKVDVPWSEVLADPRFALLMAVLVVGPIVASLIAIAVIRKRTLQSR